MTYIGLIIYIGLSFLVAHLIGRNKKIGFTNSLIICLLTSPFIGFLITEGGAAKNPRGCNWCGNKENEAEYCGLCNKNENGEIRPINTKNKKQ
jgi:Na+-driven multidrug efflux pump